MQGFRRRPRLILQLEVRMKRREVQRHIGTEIFQYPLRQLTRFGRRIVQRRNDQIRNLEPHVRLVFQPLQGVQNRLQMR